MTAIVEPSGTDVVLRDGSTVHVRRVQADDEPRLLAFLRGLDSRSRWRRFFSVPSERFLAEAAHARAAADPGRTFGLVATTGVPEAIVAHAEFVIVGRGRAEVAMAVADAFQGRGLGTLLLERLAENAAARGIDVFEATVLPANSSMLQVFRESGLACEVRSAPGEIQVTLATAMTEEARRRFDDRERVAAVNALEKFFHPRAAAVVGAGRDPDSVGGRIFRNLLAGRFPGPVHPVNPRASEVQGLPAYPTVEAIPGPVDLAVIVVPAEHVVAVAEQCARKGVAALLVISAGFAELGAPGRDRQAELLHVCRAAGMRLIGPNCLGLVSTDPAARLDATFAPAAPPSGAVGLLTQSGGVGLALISQAATLGLGLSTFVSVGNKADVSANDLLQYWETDPRTRVILLYLESFGNPRKFARIARRVGRVKPIVAVKSGRSAAGSRAAASHTGAMVASDVTVDALFHQTGVIRTDTLEQMFDVATLLAHQPIPRGRRVGILTNAGGPAILCADACEAEGLAIPALRASTQDALRGFLPVAASLANPVDMIATASADDYGRAIRVLGADPDLDALIVIFIPPLATRASDVARAVLDAARHLGGKKPILGVFMSSPDAAALLAAGDVCIPAYAFPEDAALALARASRHGRWLARPQARPARIEARRDEATAIVARALGRGDGWLEPGEVTALLDCYGLPVIEQRVVAGVEQAAWAAHELGGAVALKAVAPGLLHKTEAGAVRLDLRGPDEVRNAAAAMVTALTVQGHAPEGFIVQRMAAPGVEMIVGVVHDPSFGPVVACGAGGVLVELLRDVVVRLAPVGESDAEEMVRGLKTSPLLTGFRGQPARDLRALHDVIVRVSALAEDVPDVAELDCNPLIVGERGAVVVDARVRVTARRGR